MEHVKAGAGVEEGKVDSNLKYRDRAGVTGARVDEGLSATRGGASAEVCTSAAGLDRDRASAWG